MPTPDPDILKTITEEQRKRGWSRYRLAKQCGMHQGNITAYLDGRAEITTSKLRRLMDALDLDLAPKNP